MQTARLFMNGKSQAVRLPKAFRFRGQSVYVNRVGDCVVLVPRRDPWRAMFDAAKKFTPDFMAERDQGTMVEREGLDG